MVRNDRASAPSTGPRTDAQHSRTAPTDRRTAGQSPGADGVATYAWLPDDVEPRPYIELRPADTPLDHTAAEAAMRRLIAALRERQSNGLVANLTRSTEIPRVEILLVADGQPDTGLRYLVGTEPVDDDLRELVRGILRTALPNDTELTTTTFHPLEPRRYCPAPSGGEREHEATGESPRDDREAAAGPETNRAPVAPDDPLPDDAEPYVAGVEWCGVAHNRYDWTTPLTTAAELAGDAASPTDRRLPLASVVEALATASVPALYQVVVRPYHDWTDRAESYSQALSEGTVTFFDTLLDTIAPRSREERRSFTPRRSDQERIDDIAARETHTTATVSARAVALTHTNQGGADALAASLASALAPLSGPYHTLRGEVRTDSDRGIVGGSLAKLPWRDSRPPGTQVYADLIGVRADPPTYTQLKTRLPGVGATSRGIVATPAELPGACLAGAAELPPPSQRALDTQRSERTGLTLPPPRTLARYRGEGWPLGRPIDTDRQADADPLVLPPALQPLHLLVVGATGAGKSTALTSGLIENHEATDGPAILVDAKGGGMARDYLRAHYTRHGSLEDLIYLDCTEVLPAISVFDIRPLLDAGVSREEARSRVAGHYEEILAGVMGQERFERAIRSPEVIRNHLRALFDPVHGADVVQHRDLVDAIRRTQQDSEPPAVTDPDLAGYFESLLESEPRVFSQVMGGALARVETIATDSRLAPLFDHVPERETVDDGRGSGDEMVGQTGRSTAAGDSAESSDAATESTPEFTMRDLLDEDRVVVIDFGGLEDSVKDALTLVLLAELWTALKIRNEHRDPDADGSLVNLYLEDAGSVAGTDLVDTLLSQGRSFGLSMTLGVQYPGQLETSDPERDTYREALNETATILAGNVSVDDELARVLATEEHSPSQIARRLASLGRGEWLCRPAAGFGQAPPAPFLVESLTPPAGHPASDRPVATGVERAVTRCRERSAERYGLRQAEVSSVDGADAAGDERERDSGGDGAPAGLSPRTQLDTTLPHTQRLPSCVAYDEAADALRCTVCDTRHDATDAGMEQAIECCTGLDAVDRDDVPVVDTNLKLSPREVEDSSWSVTQLLFLQVVHNAQRGQYESPGYDLLRDSMIRLREYAGIAPDAVVDLIDADLLREDGDHPHRLYSVTATGRDAINESWREGVDYGDGLGDMTESSQHRLAVEAGRRLIEQVYAADPDSGVDRVKPYHEVDVDGEMVRLDCAGLDQAGDVVVAFEAERINNDVDEAVPSDFDKMAACDPEEAIWIVLSRSAGQRVVDALLEPPDGEPRLDAAYSERSPLHRRDYDAPGLTQIYAASYVRDSLLE